MEPAGLSMARYLRESFEASKDAPDGIDVFTWIWAPARVKFVEVEAPDHIVLVEPTIDALLGEIRFPARFGIDTEHRIAVLFWGNGGPTPTIPRPWHLIDQLALEGRALMSIGRKPKNRLKPERPRPNKEWKDKDYPVDDGEGWQK
jgi:hypothetical protein